MLYCMVKSNLSNTKKKKKQLMIKKKMKTKENMDSTLVRDTLK